MKAIRNLYEWVLSWSQSKWGAYALFIMALAESSFFPIPPDVLLIGLALGKRKNAIYYAFICLTGSIIGAVIGYSIGAFLWWNSNQEFSALAQIFFNNIPGFDTDLFYNIKSQYDEWNFWIVFTAGFTPIPYKIFTISAGAFNINFPMFLIASIIGRGGRFFLLGTLIWKFGSPIKSFIDRYFNLLAILFTTLLIGGFLIIKYLI